MDVVNVDKIEKFQNKDFYQSLTSILFNVCRETPEISKDGKISELDKQLIELEKNLNKKLDLVSKSEELEPEIDKRLKMHNDKIQSLKIRMLKQLGGEI